MLTEQRHDEILKMLDEKKSVTLQEIKERLDISESTIRRDLNTLHDQGRLIKVFGGAVALDSRVTTREENIPSREALHKEDKLLVARYAAGLVDEGDFVYLDAGTTTGYMIDYLPVIGVTYVTNAVAHAKRLADLGAHVIIIGGELKATTEALAGNEAYVNLKKYNFSVGFFGANGVDLTAGFTTPDINEAMIKQCAMQHSQKRYVVCDGSKFGTVSPVTFAGFNDAIVVTNTVADEMYKNCTNIIRVEAGAPSSLNK